MKHLVTVPKHEIARLLRNLLVHEASIKRDRDLTQERVSALDKQMQLVTDGVRDYIEHPARLVPDAKIKVTLAHTTTRKGLFGLFSRTKKIPRTVSETTIPVTEARIARDITGFVNKLLDMGNYKTSGLSVVVEEPHWSLAPAMPTLSRYGTLNIQDYNGSYYISVKITFSEKHMHLASKSSMLSEHLGQLAPLRSQLEMGKKADMDIHMPVSDYVSLQEMPLCKK